MAKRTPKILKFPVLNNVEYISIYRTGRSVLELDGSEVEGKTWREFQLYLGEKIPVGTCQFTMKFKNNNQLHTGAVRAAKLGEVYAPKEEKMSDEILKEFRTIKDQLNKATSGGGISFEMLLASTKQAYEAQVTYKDQVINDKNELIREFKKEIEELEDDLNECMKESGKSNSLATYFDIGQKLLNARFGSPKPVTLKESDMSDVPKEVMEIIGAVNWSDPQITPEVINKICIGLKQYVFQFLPMKG